MTKITLKHLRYFDALARHRHFGRAAEASAISQPALSLQVKELEEILGAPLVERGARVSLTELGEEFSLRAREVLRAVDELGALGRAAAGAVAGRVRRGGDPDSRALSLAPGDAASGAGLSGAGPAATRSGDAETGARPDRGEA